MVNIPTVGVTPHGLFLFFLSPPLPGVQPAQVRSDLYILPMFCLSQLFFFNKHIWTET